MKLAGVESADVSLTAATASIRLKPDNRITLAQLRDVLKKNGFPTRDAQVSARGRIVERDGRRLLDLLNGSTIELAESPAAARLPVNAVVEVVGIAVADGKSSEKLTVKETAAR